MRVSVGDVRLFLEVLGRRYGLAAGGDGLVTRPSVIGLHGGPGLDGTKLRFQLERIADLAQVLVPDQRGHGRSDLGPPESWNLAQWAADVKALGDTLELERPIVLGVSFGGFVAQTYAAAHPEHPGGLILVSCGARFAREQEIAAAAARAAGAPPADRPGEAERARLDALRIRTLDVNRHFEPEGFAMDLRPGLARVRCPVLLLVGEHDPLVPRALADELLGALPAGLGRLVVIRGAGHELFTDDPDASWRAVREFIAELHGTGEAEAPGSHCES